MKYRLPGRSISMDNWARLTASNWEALFLLSLIAKEEETKGFKLCKMGLMAGLACLASLSFQFVVLI